MQFIDLSEVIHKMEKLLPNLYHLKIPLTDNPLGYLNSYLITSPGRNLIIDTGLNHDHCYQAMTQYLAELNVDLGKTDIFLTHFHPDHGGLVPRIATPGSKIYLGESEIKTLTSNLSYKYFINYMTGQGVPEDQVPEIFLKTTFVNYLENQMDQMVFVNDSDTLSIGDYRFVAIVTPGHTNGHVCLYEPEKKLLVSGDHVIGDITPGVQCIFEHIDPLGDYYKSLDKIAELDTKLVLPGHRETFKSARERIAAIKTHHDNRLDEMVDILRNGVQNAYQIASQMKWQMSGHQWEDTEKLQRWFATSETVAHLRYLEERGQIIKTVRSGGDYYQLVNAKPSIRR